MEFLIFDNTLPNISEDVAENHTTAVKDGRWQSRMPSVVVVNRSSADGRVTGCYDVCVTSRQAEGGTDRNQTNEELEIKMKRTKP